MRKVFTISFLAVTREPAVPKETWACVIILIQILHRNSGVRRTHTRGKVIFHSVFVRLSYELFFFSNLKWELQEAPSLSIKAATLRIKIFRRNVSAQVINSWGWALNKLSFNSSLLAHLCSTSVTPANTSYSPELLFQPLLEHQDELPSPAFSPPRCTTFYNKLLTTSIWPLQICKSLCYQCWHFQGLGNKQN